MPESHNEEDLVALTVLGLLGMESRARPSRAEASRRRNETPRRSADRKGGLSEEERNDLNKRRNEEQELPGSSLIALGPDGEPLGADVFGDSDSELAEGPRGNVPTPIAKSDRPPQANADEFQITDNGDLTKDQKEKFVERFGARETIAKIPGVMDILQDELMSGPITATDTQFILQYLAQEPGVPTEEITEKMSKKTGFLARMWRRIFGSRNKQLLDKLTVTSSNLTEAKIQTAKLQNENTELLEQVEELKRQKKDLKRQKKDLENKVVETVNLTERARNLTSPEKLQQVKTLKEEIKTLEKKVADEQMIASGQISNMQTIIDKTNEQLTSAQAENAKLQSKLQAQQDSLVKEKAQFKAQRDALMDAAKDLKSQNKELAKQLTAEKAKEKANQDEIDEKIAKNTADLAKINSTMQAATEALEVAQEKATAAEQRAAAAEAAKAAADKGSQDLREQLEAAKKENLSLQVEMKRRAAELQASLGVNQSVEGINSSGVNRAVTPEKGRLFLDNLTSPIVDRRERNEEEDRPKASKKSEEVLTENEMKAREKTRRKAIIAGQGQSPNSPRQKILAAQKASEKGSPGRKLFNALPDNIKERIEERKKKRYEPRRSSRQSNPVDRYDPSNPSKTNLFKPLRF